MARKSHANEEIERRINIRAQVEDRIEHQAVWVNDAATESERESAVMEVFRDVEAWYPEEEVELMDWGETGRIRDADTWEINERTEVGW